MIQILHTADLHLGSKLTSRFPKHLTEERRQAVRATFQNMLSYANKQNIRHILLAGDIFDSDLPLKHDKAFFYQLIGQYPEITFYYLRGNHDCMTSYTEKLHNLKTFTDNWQYYHIEPLHIGDKKIVIAGIEQTKENATSLYHSLKLSADDINIVLLHGQDSKNKFGKDIVNITALQEKNIDYLALGHLHSYAYKKLDKRGHYAYSGCLEGRGFDELGRKGFMHLTIKDGKIDAKFVPYCRRQLHTVYFDLSPYSNMQEAIDGVKANLQVQQRDLYKLILTGKVDFAISPVAEIVQRQFSTKCHYFEVENTCMPKLALESLAQEESLRGEFVRTVLQETKDENFVEEIINLGLQMLSEQE